MSFVYWSALGQDFSPAGATERTGQRVETRQEQGWVLGGREGETTNELRARVCCHASDFEEYDRTYSHGYGGAENGILLAL